MTTLVFLPFCWPCSSCPSYCHPGRPPRHLPLAQWQIAHLLLLPLAHWHRHLLEMPVVANMLAVSSETRSQSQDN